MLKNPLSDNFVSFLSLFRRCSLTSADGPHRLISDDYFWPVVDFLANSSKLSGVHFVCLARFPLVKLLTDASHYTQTVLQGSSSFLGNDFITLSIYVTTLAVAKDNPVDLGVLKHLGARFSRICAILVNGGVLSWNLNIGSSKSLLNCKQVDGWWCNHHFDFLGVKLKWF